MEKGIAIDSSSHAIGTVNAMEPGETEGAMASLSIAVSGLLTVLAASLPMNPRELSGSFPDEVN